jgi:pimeloyl-ACP methyl ester carboxylesterase
MDLEKEDRRTAPSVRSLRHHQHGLLKRKKVLATTMAVIALLWLANSDIGSSLFLNLHHESNPTWHPPPIFDWDSIETKTDLQYTPCYEHLHLQCARLELPMDWFNQTSNNTISLAVIRQPAVVPVTHPHYGGAILLNPGGPGGSGVGLVQRSGEYLRSVFDTNTTDGKYFDLISFDPRGVGVSKPRVDCFHDRNVAANWQQRIQEEGWFEASDAALGRQWSMSLAKGRSCSEYSNYDGDDVKQYVSTASVARDMLELVEKHGEWREREAQKLLYGGCSHWRRLIPKSVQRIEVPLALQYQPGEEKIQYYGLSYGSYLGGTFAAMFPDRVERLAVDGVVEYENYRSGNWSSNLLDTEKSMATFYFHCARAGFPACLLSNKANTSTPAEIENRTNAIINSLYHNPLPVTTPYFGVLSYSDLKGFVLGALYTPMIGFPVIGFLLYTVEQNNGSYLELLMRAMHPSGCSSDPLAQYYDPIAGDAQTAIACSDADDQSHLTRSEFEAFAQELTEKYPSAGSYLSTMRMNCVHYTLPAVHRYTGSWKVNTSHPVLFIGNTADPVTPGLFAREMAKGFDGAVALMQDSGGHTSASVFSYCTTGYLRRYFQTGELPPVNTTCAADAVPFGGWYRPGDGDAVVGAEVDNARAVRERWERMAEGALEHGVTPGGRALNRLHQVLRGRG